MNWRYLYCPVCANKEVTLWGKRVACSDCESADKPVRFKEERVPQEDSPIITKASPASLGIYEMEGSHE